MSAGYGARTAQSERPLRTKPCRRLLARIAHAQGSTRWRTCSQATCEATTATKAQSLPGRCTTRRSTVAAKRQRTSPSTKALNARALPLTRSHCDLSCAHETLTEDPGPDGDARARLNLGHGSKETARSYGYITACTIEGPLDQFGALEIRAPPGDGFLFLALPRGHVPVCALDINSSDIHTRRGL